MQSSWSAHLPEGKLRPREGLICPGHRAAQILTRTSLPSHHHSFPVPAATWGGSWRLGWGCAPCCLGLHGRSPGPRPSHCQRLPSIFCPPHLSENHEEKSLPSLRLSCRCDIWPPSEPPSPAGTLLSPKLPKAEGRGDGARLGQLAGHAFRDHSGNEACALSLRRKGSVDITDHWCVAFGSSCHLSVQ